MSSFRKAISVVLAHEGGYQSGTDDAGGPTNYGISQAWLHSIGKDWSAERIKAITREEAIGFYLTYWWLSEYEGIDCQEVATKLFDMAVNMGARQAHKLLQRAVNSCGGFPLKVDGIVGPMTLAAVNSTDPEQLITKLVAVQCDFYRELAANPNHPERKRWLQGWLARAAWPLGSKEAA